ncbi:MAG: hypothetical protein HY860_03760 [Chlamydiales bacterium]|nr:hypothetical protein [Chlamydiales bacterium]
MIPQPTSPSASPRRTPLPLPAFQTLPVAPSKYQWITDPITTRISTAVKDWSYYLFLTMPYNIVTSPFTACKACCRSPCARPDNILRQALIDTHSVATDLRKGLPLVDKKKVKRLVDRLQKIIDISHGSTQQKQYPSIFALFASCTNAEQNFNTIIQRLNRLPDHKDHILNILDQTLIPFLESFFTTQSGFVTTSADTTLVVATQVFNESKPTLRAAAEAILPSIAADATISCLSLDVDQEQSDVAPVSNKGLVDFFTLFSKYAPPDQLPRVFRWVMLHMQRLQTWPTHSPTATDSDVFRLVDTVASGGIDAIDALSQFEDTEDSSPTTAPIETFATRLTAAKNTVIGPSPEPTQPINVLKTRTDDALASCATTTSFYIIHYLCKSILGETESLAELDFEIRAQIEHKEGTRAWQKAYDRLCMEKGYEEKKQASLPYILKQLEDVTPDDRLPLFISLMHQAIDARDDIGFIQKTLMKWSISLFSNAVMDYTKEFLEKTLSSLRSSFNSMRAHPTYDVDPTVFTQFSCAFQSLFNIIKDYAYSQGDMDFAEYFLQALQDPTYNRGLTEPDMFQSFTSAMVDRFAPNVAWTDEMDRYSSVLVSWGSRSVNKLSYFFKMTLIMIPRIILVTLKTLVVWPLQAIVNITKNITIKWTLQYFEIPQKVTYSVQSVFFGPNKFSSLTSASKQIILDVLDIIYKKLLDDSSSNDTDVNVAKYKETKKAIRTFVMVALEVLEARSKSTPHELKKIFEDTGLLKQFSDQVKDLVMPEVAETVMFLILNVYEAFLNRENNENLLHDGIIKLSAGLEHQGEPITDVEKDAHEKLDQDMETMLDNLLLIAVKLGVRKFFLSFGKEKASFVKKYFDDVETVLISASGDTASLSLDETDDTSEDSIAEGYLAKWRQSLESGDNLQETMNTMRDGCLIVLDRIQTLSQQLTSAFETDLPDHLQVARDTIVLKVTDITTTIVKLQNAVLITDLQDRWTSYLDDLEGELASFQLLFQQVETVIEREEDPDDDLASLSASYQKIYDLNKEILSLDYLPNELKVFSNKLQDQLAIINESMEHLTNYTKICSLKEVLSTPYHRLRPVMQHAITNVSSSYKRSTQTFLQFLRDKMQSKITTMGDGGGICSISSVDDASLMGDFHHILTAFLPPDELTPFYFERTLHKSVGVLPDIVKCSSITALDNCLKIFDTKIQELEDSFKRNIDKSTTTLQVIFDHDNPGSVFMQLNELRSILATDVNIPEETTALIASLTSFQEEFESIKIIAPESDLFLQLNSHPFLERPKLKLHEFFKKIVFQLFDTLPQALPLLLRHAVIYPNMH